MGNTLLVLAALSTIAAEYEPVTDARLVSPEPENWLMYRRTYDSHGYSPLTEITRSWMSMTRVVVGVPNEPSSTSSLKYT